ncbi:hypothetical protein F4703DRAFT_1798431 [Phycomyces blakesleeanus]
MQVMGHSQPSIWKLLEVLSNVSKVVSSGGVTNIFWWCVHLFLSNGVTLSTCVPCFFPAIRESRNVGYFDLLGKSKVYIYIHVLFSVHFQVAVLGVNHDLSEGVCDHFE